MTEIEVHCNLIEIVAAHVTGESDGKDTLLIPVKTKDGLVKSANGAFYLNEDDAEQVIGAFDSQGVQLLVDYDHRSVPGYEAPDGSAPASGWIKKLRYVAGKGLYGLVRWTKRAVELIRAEEYKYLSPTLILNADTKHSVRLKSVGLVNEPAIVGMPAVVAKQLLVKESAMPGEKKTQVNQEGMEGGEVTPDQRIGQIEILLKGKGVTLDKGAGRDAVLDAVIAFLEGGSSEDGEGEGGGDNAEVAASARRVLGLEPGAGKDETLVALSLRLKERADADGELGELRTEVAAMKDREATRNAKALVDADIKANKINPKDTKHLEYCLAFAKRDPENYRKLLGGFPAYAEPGRTTPPPGGPPAGSDSEETLINKALEEHKGNHKDALIAVQKRLMGEYEGRGLTRKAAREHCERAYPKIFGAAA